MDKAMEKQCEELLKQIGANWAMLESFGCRFCDAKSDMTLTWDDIGIDLPGEYDEEEEEYY